MHNGRAISMKNTKARPWLVPGGGPTCCVTQAGPGRYPATGALAVQEVPARTQERVSGGAPAAGRFHESPGLPTQVPPPQPFGQRHWNPPPPPSPDCVSADPRGVRGHPASGGVSCRANRNRVRLHSSFPSPTWVATPKSKLADCQVADCTGPYSYTADPRACPPSIDCDCC
jgi:hypothetical protein